MKKVLVKLPICFLFFIVTFQMYLFFTKNKSTEMVSLENATSALLTDGAKEYRSPKNPLNEPLYIFAQRIDRDIPLESKILYLNSTEVGGNTVIYYQINTYKPRNHNASYIISPNPREEDIVKIMRAVGAEYLVDYNNENIVDGAGQVIKGKPAIYKIDSNTLEIFKEYD